MDISASSIDTVVNKVGSLVDIKITAAIRTLKDELKKELTEELKVAISAEIDAKIDEKCQRL